MASDETRDRLLAAGQRITPQRDVIAGALEDAGRPLTAHELAARLELVSPGIGRATVFRTLQSLQAAGVVERIALPGDQPAYLICANPRHHHHLVCRSCGVVEELAEDEVAAFLGQLERRHRFTVDHVSFDVYGRCATCAPKDTARAGAGGATRAAGEAGS